MSARPTPHEILWELLRGFIGTRALAFAVDLSVADELEARPLPVDELAARAGADPDLLYRFLRPLAMLDVCEEGPARAFRNTAASDLLRRGAAGWQEFVVVYDSVYRSLLEAPRAVRDGGELSRVCTASTGRRGWRRIRPSARRSTARWRRVRVAASRSSTRSSGVATIRSSTWEAETGRSCSACWSAVPAFGGPSTTWRK